MTTQLSIGILGTGFSSVHVERLKKLEGIQVAAVWGRSLSKAGAFIARMGLPGALPFADFDQMLADSRLDALYVCLPPHAHHGQEQAAAQRGIHLFLEKPIAYNSAQAEAIVEAIEKAGVVSQVGYHMRYFKGVRLLKALPNLGRATLFEGRFWCNFTGPSWWVDKAGGHGQVFEQVTHIYDMARYLCGEPEQASGLLANLCHQDDPAYTVEDSSVSIIRFRNNALGMVSGSNCATPERFVSSFRAIFEHASLEYTASGGPQPRTATLVTHDGTTIIEQQEFIEDSDPYLDQVIDFVKAIRGEGPQTCPAREGLATIRLTEAVMQSAESGGVPVPL